MDVALAVNIGMTVLAYVMADKLISSQGIKDRFIKANLFGKDMNKISKDKVKVYVLEIEHTVGVSRFLFVCRPEGLGVVSGAVFLIILFLFIPIPFLPSLVGEAKEFDHREVEPMSICFIRALPCSFLSVLPVHLCAAVYLLHDLPGFCR